MTRLKKKLIGDTVQITWINSGSTPSAIHSAIYNGSETLINSETMVSSGNGHYYTNYTIPNTIGFYVAETLATISGKPYRNRTSFRAGKGEVD